jgi:hypothetical protein
LAPGGLLIASVFTIDDPGMAARREAGEMTVAPATFRLSGGGLIHYFAPGELARLFGCLQVLEYDEARRLDTDGDLRAGASLVARKPGSGGPHRKERRERGGS